MNATSPSGAARDATLEELSGMPAFLESQLGGLHTVDARMAGARGAFAPVEHAWHLAELEVEGFSERLRRLLVEDGPLLADFDGTRLAAERKYQARSLAEGLAAFRRAREANLEVLRSIPDGGWEGRGTQEGLGTISVAELPGRMVDHDRVHRLEIQEWLHDVPERIRALTREFVAGFDAGDVARMMALYADDYVDVNLRRPRQTRAERAAYYRRIVDPGSLRVQVVPEEILVAGEYAFARGEILLRRQAGGSRELRYIEIWKRFPEGWRSVWGIDAPIQEEPHA